MRRSSILFLILALVVPVFFLGCSGDDGAQGVAGPPGPPGSPTPVVAEPESCSVCHSNVAALHAATLATDGNNVVTASVVSAAFPAGGDATLQINVKIAGVNSDIFATVSRAYAYVDNVTSFLRNSIDVADTTIVSNGSGNYTVTLAGDNVVDGASFLVTLTDGTGLLATVTAHDPQNAGTPLRDVAGNDGCVACHGTYVFDGGHHGANPDLDACVICHVRDNTANFVTLLDNGTKVGVASDIGKRLTVYVHGIHNSHNMPDGKYYRNTTTSEFSVGYPSDMRNCSVCHTGARTAAVAAEPLSYSLCMSCHVNWDGFVDHNGAAVFDAANFHRTLVNATDCMACHSGLPTLNEVADFHNSFEAADSHYDSFFRGVDISYDNPDDVLFQITGVTKTGDNVAFTWTASKGGAAVDPCNDNLATGPTFQSLGAYLAYFKGDDLVNETIGTSPGQPAGARNLFTSLSTVCAANVATTTGLTVPATVTYAEKALLAIGGKPLNQGTFTIGAVDTAMGYFVRVPSPTYAFSMTDGSAVAPRRSAVNSDKCNSCHRGTLYQHGGDRVDNEQMCVICHNPSAGDKNNRLDRYQIVNADGTVNTSATYDGKTNETYDMRYMIHSVHGVEKRLAPWVVYRSRGIFAFATADMTKPTGWPGEGAGLPIYGSTNSSTQTHAWTVVHYPRALRECTACHNDGLYEVPDQTLAVPLTVDPGDSYADQSDDIVIGPAAGACIACHNTAPVRSHATQPPNGYKANVTKDDMLLLAQP